STAFLSVIRRCRLRSTLLPYTTLFRSIYRRGRGKEQLFHPAKPHAFEQNKSSGISIFILNHRTLRTCLDVRVCRHMKDIQASARSEEHTSELQSRFDLVCRLLLEKRNV